MTLLRRLSFLLGSQTVILIVLLFWTDFFLWMLIFVFCKFCEWVPSNGFSSIGKFWCCGLSFYWLPIKFTMGCPASSHSLWLFLCWLGWSSWSFENFVIVPWEDIFKLGTSAAASKFCKWVLVRIDVYIPHRKYQVKSHSSPWFSASCTAAIVHRNPFFFFFVYIKRINLLILK